MNDLDPDHIGAEGLIGYPDEPRSPVDIDIRLWTGQVGDLEARHLGETLALVRVDHEDFGMHGDIADRVEGVDIGDEGNALDLAREKLLDRPLPQGQADSELAEEAAAGDREVIALGGATDGGQEGAHLDIARPMPLSRRIIGSLRSEGVTSIRGEKLASTRRRASMASRPFCNNSRR